MCKRLICLISFVLALGLLGDVASLAGKTATFTQPLHLLLTPPDPKINLYNDDTIDLKDYALLADMFLDEVLWP